MWTASELGYFQANGKKQTLFQFTKKVINNSLKLQTSLLPISGKVFFKENNLLSQHQTGFILGDSCFQQLITITHQTYKAFGCSASPEVRGVFLDISKPFDNVWHDELLAIQTFKRNAIIADLLKLIGRFLSDKYQRFVLNGKTSKWNKITARVSQGSILTPLYFCIYINDISSEL